MAGVIQKIRDRAWVVIVVIAFSMFLFLAQTVLSDYRSFFGPDTTVGKAAGHTIEYNAFSERYQTALNNQQRSGALDDNQRKQLQDQVWESVLNESILGAEYGSVGLEVNGKESYRLFVGPNPSPYIAQIPAFQDPGTRQFDPERVKYFLEQSKSNEQLRAQLRELESQIIQSRQQEQYFKMVQGAVFVSKEEARRKAQEDAQRVSFEYLAINFGAVADSLATPSDADFLAYYEENKNRFKQEKEETILKYVLFRKDPSPKDTATALDALNKLKAEFAQTNEDSLFAIKESDISEPAAFKSVEELTAEEKEFIAKNKVGSLNGPRLDGNAYKLTKFSAQKRDEVPAAKIRHILIRPTGNNIGDTLRAQQKADSVLKQLKGDNFRQVCMAASDDERTRFNGGDLGWYYRKGQFGKGFDESLKGAVKGKKYAVRSQAGYHVVEVLVANPNVVRLATITKEITPSTATVNELERKAAKLSGAIDNASQFDTVAAKMGYDVRTSLPLTAGNTNIPGLTGASELVRWAMTTDAGKLSGVKTTDNAFFVGYISQRNPKGYQSLEQVKDQIRTQVTNRKKSKYILDKLKTADASSLETLKNAYGQGCYISRAEGITANSPSIPGLGNDPLLLGKVLTMKKDQISKPIVGNGGVYVVKVSNVEAGTAPDDKALADQQKNLESQRRGSMAGKVYNGVRNHAQIEDYRYKFGF